MSRYSPDEITQIVRGKMYYDLQMVRNGSLVGAVLGGIFYGLTFGRGAQMIRYLKSSPLRQARNGILGLTAVLYCLLS